MSTYAGTPGNARLPQQATSGHHGGMAFLKDLWSKMGQNDFAGLAAEMAYNWMMSLVPILIFLFSLFGLFASQGDNFGLLMNDLRRLLPGEAFDLVRETIEEMTRANTGGLAIVSLLGALWTGSNGGMVIEKALNRAYRCVDKPRNMMMQQLIALAIVAGVGVILLICSNLIMFGGSMIDGIQAYFNPDGLIVRILEVVRWLLPLTALMLVSMFIYTIAPNTRPRMEWKRTWPGALTFVVLWVLISSLFSLYVSNMGNYNKIYGSMGAIIILMFWLYLSSFALLIGGQVNAMRNNCDEGTLNGPPEPEAPPATSKAK